MAARDDRDTRERLLRAGSELFAATGLHGATVRDIAGAAGANVAAANYHFGSKEALYGEVFEGLLSDWIRRVNAAVGTRQQGFAMVEQVVGASFDFFIANPQFVRLMRREAIDGGQHLGIDLAAALRPMWDRAVAFMEREMDTGTFRRHDAEQLLVTGYGALLSYFSDAPFLGGLLDADPLQPEATTRRREHIISFFLTALRP